MERHRKSARLIRYTNRYIKLIYTYYMNIVGRVDMRA